MRTETDLRGAATTRVHHVLVALLALTAAACSCNGDDPELPDGGDAASCAPVGASCEAVTCCSGAICEGGVCVDEGPCAALGESCTDEACCSGGVCEGDVCVMEPCAELGEACGAIGCCGEGRCEDAECVACSSDGRACAVNSDCCSDLCDGGRCTTGEGCALVGAACTGDTDCCAGACTGDVCVPPPVDCASLGEACANAGACCSGNCEGALCATSPGCRPAGESCTEDSQCCIGLCSDGLCAASGACRVAGEPCGTEGLSGSCCSTLCLDPAGTGVATCQFLGGCRVIREVCNRDSDCCSGSCAESGTTSDGRSIMRCERTTSCQQPGETCAFGGSSSNCCPSGGGRRGCEPAAIGVSRCLGGGRCEALAGDACEADADCCPEPAGLRCRPSVAADGADRCCLPDGEMCAFGDLCCGGVCTPDGEGVLRCGSACVPDGGSCTTARDCCGCACAGGTCSSDPADCSECMLGQLGDFCSTTEECCNAPPVYCNSDVAEFSTCVVR